MTSTDSVICIGVFDGVHRGHQHLLAVVSDEARRRGMQGLAIILDPPPLEVLRPGVHVRRLCPPAESVRRIRAVGVEAELRAFDAAVRAQTAEQFLASLAPDVVVRALVMTATSSFGRDREGTAAHLAAIGSAAGFDVVEIAMLDDDGPISSSRIRQLVADGQVQEAARLLGQPSAVWGTVIHGDGRGRSLGFPTANLAMEYVAALPATGIYLGSADIGDGRPVPALVSVGRRPTFGDDGSILVEAHLLDWDGDLYGRTVGVAVTERLRDERKFASSEALVAQMRADERLARGRLADVREAGIGLV